MHACYCAPYRKGCISAKAFYPAGQEIPLDKKSPWTRNPPGQGIPRDKESPGTRNPPGQGILRDKNPPGKARAGTASEFLKR